MALRAATHEVRLRRPPYRHSGGAVPRPGIILR